MKPARLRPGTIMPDSGLTAEEAQAAAKYLYAGGAPAPAGGAWRGGDAGAGEKLFVERGCRGCHAIAPADDSLSPRVPNLTGIGLKVRGDWLFNWLKSPRSYNPHTAMPQLTLTDTEIRNLVAFLLSRKEGADIVAAAPRFNADADVAAGRAVIERYECATCHELKGVASPAAAFELAQGGGSSNAAVLQNGRLLVAYYNCRGCHQIEGSGGAIAAHLERKTFAPPTLEGEGARVQPSWLVKFVQHPTTLRPWLQIRMPNYGFSEVQANTLAKYFAALSDVEPTDEPRPSVSAESSERGLRRLGHFKCSQCHPTTQELPKDVEPENLSINLMLAKDRLRPSWIRQFLARPKAIVGMQTRMPTVFYTIDGTPKVEHPDQDIDDIAAYLLQMTEPLDVALARLDAGRKAEAQKKEVDWSKIEY